MFYEEKVIDGKLMFRNSPDGEWYGFTYEVLTERLMRAEAFVKHHHLSALPEAVATDAARIAIAKYKRHGAEFSEEAIIKDAVDAALHGESPQHSPSTEGK